MIGASFWFDNAITHPILQFWWLLLVAAYVACCLTLPESVHRFISRIQIAVVSAVFVLTSIWVFDDIMTIYFSGVILLVSWGLGAYAATANGLQTDALNRTVMVLVSVALVILPVSVNRILVKLPNLSAGTSITLYESEGITPNLDDRFYNRMNDKLEIEVYLGSQIYFEQPHEAPKLKIETSIAKVVVRLLSISYQHRLAYMDLPLLELTGEELLQVKLSERGGTVDMEMDRIFLLLSGFKVGEPVWLTLPSLESIELDTMNRLLIGFFRLLLWLVICFATSVWLPRAHKVAGS